MKVYSSAWTERLLAEQEAKGSNPFTPVRAVVAKSGSRRTVANGVGRLKRPSPVQIRVTALKIQYPFELAKRCHL